MAEIHRVQFKPHGTHWQITFASADWFSAGEWVTNSGTGRRIKLARKLSQDGLGQTWLTFHRLKWLPRMKNAPREPAVLSEPVRKIPLPQPDAADEDCEDECESPAGRAYRRAHAQRSAHR